MTTVAKALIDIARRIGRWLLQRIIARGAFIIANYMRERVEVFKARLSRAKTDRRKKWLRGRIRRWTKAANWLADWRIAVSRCITDEVDALIENARKLPLVASCERLARAA